VRVKSSFTRARQCVSCVKAQAWIAAIVLEAVLLTGSSNGTASSTAWIVFAASPQHGTQPSQLFRITTTGEGLNQITTGVRAATEPAFSPDGTRVAFTRAFSGIFVMRANGTRLTRLTDGGDDHFPVWAPDGTRIAFLRPTASSPTKGGSFKLFVMNANGRRQHVLRLAPHPAGRPSWLPGGKSIVISSKGSFYEVNASNGKVKRHFGPTYDATNGAPFWTLAPNGRTIAVIGPRPGPGGCEGVACEVSALYLLRFGATLQSHAGLCTRRYVESPAGQWRSGEGPRRRRTWRKRPSGRCSARLATVGLQATASDNAPKEPDPEQS